MVPWGWFLVRDLWWGFDAVSFAMPILALVSLLITMLLAWVGRWQLFAVGLSFVVVTAVATAAPRVPESTRPPAEPVRITSANVALVRGGQDPSDAAGQLLRRDADIVVAFEMPLGFSEALSRLARLQHSPLVHRFAFGETGVWSRFPVRSVGALPSGTIRAEIGARTPFVLFAAHSEDPFSSAASFEAQRTIAESLAQAPRFEVLPVVVVADLHASDRATGYRTLRSAYRDAMRVSGWVPDTFGRYGDSNVDDGFNFTRMFLLRLDHLFVPPDWCSVQPRVFAIPHSDHHGVEATVGPCPVGA